MSETSVFAETIMKQRYSHTKLDGTLETWEEVVDRVVKHVLSVVTLDKYTKNEIRNIILEKKFIPAGRYLYAAGRPFHMISNCIALSVEDSREGWADTERNAFMALMSGAGIGINYSQVREEGAIIKRTGGLATGPLALVNILNETGRWVRQGSTRRSAILAILNWKHPDIHKFVESKNWSDFIKEAKTKDFNFPAPLDGTNISVQLDDEFFTAFHNTKHPKHAHATSVYWAVIKQCLQHGEPGFTVDIGENSKDVLRNAPIVGDTYILTIKGYQKVKNIVKKETIVWTGKQWAATTFTKTRENDQIVKVILTGKKEIRCSKDHPFILQNGSRLEASKLTPNTKIMESFEIVYEGKECNDAYLLGTLYGDGSFNNTYTRAEITLCGNKKVLFDKLLKSNIKPISFSETPKSYLRVYYSKNDLFKNRKKSDFPNDVFLWNYKSRLEFLAGLLDTDGNDYNGLCRLSSIQLEFLHGVRRLCNSVGLRGNINIGSKGNYKGTPTYTLVIGGDCSKIPTVRCKFADSTRDRYGSKVISVELDGTEDVYCCNVGVEEHSFVAEGLVISNCGEFTTSLDNDSEVCNLASINLSKIESLEEMKKVTELGTVFLLAGSIYSDIPYSKVKSIIEKNRRIGLGLMGIHEWLLIHNKKYDIDSDLEEYLKIYSTSTEYAHKWCDKFNINKSVKTRALAPSGTISLIAETTSGIEPLFCASYKRRYRKGTDLVEYQYVLDPTAKKLVDKGINPDNIEDAYTLSENVERRVSFQAWVQQYVDMAISGTVNLPAFGTPQNNNDTIIPFGNMLMKHLPKLRGITVYPANSRGAQPLTPVSWNTAVKHVGQVFVEGGDVCSLKGGSCNS